MYFDSIATSQLDEEVLDSMLPFLSAEYGNASAKYYPLAIIAQQAVEEAREKVAMLLHAKPESIVFTSGSTESTNLIIKGVMDYLRYYGDGRNHIITTKAEHKATLNVCKYLNGDIFYNDNYSDNLQGDHKKIDRGWKVSFLDVLPDGTVDAETIEKALTKGTGLVSTLWVNNEIGSITNVEEIANVCKANNVIYHIDATQALGKININVNKLGCDYLSCSAHKIHGPKGIGAAYLKCDNYGIRPITALIHGGEQEGGYRAGTLAVHNIVGFGKAAEIAMRDFEKNAAYIKQLDQYAVEQLLQINDIRLTTSSRNRLPGIISVFVDKIDFNNELFIRKIADKVAISTGSACSAGAPSHVLAAIGLGEKNNKVLRISLSKYSTKKEIDELVQIMIHSL